MTILTIVEQFSRMAHIVPLPKVLSAKEATYSFNKFFASGPSAKQ